MSVHNVKLNITQIESFASLARISVEVIRFVSGMASDSILNYTAIIMTTGLQYAHE